MLPGLPALAFALLALAPGPAGEDVYTWTDDQGVAHYTNEPNLIPRRYRDQARTLDGQPLPADAPEKPPPTPEAKGPPPDAPEKPAPGKSPRADEPAEEASPAPTALPPSGTAGLDEAGWRRLFVRANERVRRAEQVLARDRTALAQVSNEEGYLIVDPYGRVMTAGRATALRLQISEDERVVHEAREALYELERVAAREAIPLEWRQ
jgi:hypothetical protein